MRRTLRVGLLLVVLAGTSCRSSATRSVGQISRSFDAAAATRQWPASPPPGETMAEWSRRKIHTRDNVRVDIAYAYTCVWYEEYLESIQHGDAERRARAATVASTTLPKLFDELPDGPRVMERNAARAANGDLAGLQAFIEANDCDLLVERQ